MIKSIWKGFWGLISSLLALAGWAVLLWAVWNLWAVIVFLVGVVTVAFVLWVFAYLVLVGVPR